MTTRTAYLDCFSGISGDMFLGALLHAGLDESFLKDQLAKLNLPDLQITVETEKQQSISCKKVHFGMGEKQPLRTLPVIIPVLEQSGLDAEVIHRSIEVFSILAEAEAKVHGMPVDRIHFHEIGALDTIGDIVGVIAGLQYLKIDKLVCSPLPLGRGFVDCDHGRFPLPAPAVVELLGGIPTNGVDIEQELVTPTGAALVKVLADDFGQLPAMNISGHGYGAGTNILPNKQPNLLRIVIGEEKDVRESQQVMITETRLDDWNTEMYPHLCEKLIGNGALDVSLTPNLGKKGRPGHTLQVLSKVASGHLLQDIIFSETSTIGLRYRQEDRRTLTRDMVTVNTPWGKIEAKQVILGDSTRLYPEYNECKKIADAQNVPLDDIYRAVYAAGDEL